MIVDFDSLEEVHAANFKGGEDIVRRTAYADNAGKIIRLRLVQGSSIGYHVHENDYEVMYIISGRAHCIDDGVERELKAGDVHYCPKGHGHSVSNPYEEELVIFAVLPE
ncbi:MAG: cupin domain-containing protein [Lachnospiraceae bacterium]|nr:cupin domain-containing protein [Lachnospiraceae bacterium]